MKVTIKSKNGTTWQGDVTGEKVALYYGVKNSNGNIAGCMRDTLVGTVKNGKAFFAASMWLRIFITEEMAVSYSDAAKYENNTNIELEIIN